MVTRREDGGLEVRAVSYGMARGKDGFGQRTPNLVDVSQDVPKIR